MVKEDDIQITIIEWLRLQYPDAIVQHTSNKPRSAAQGAREKRMGAIAGWPDIQVLMPQDKLITRFMKGHRDHFEEWSANPASFFIEVKRPKTADHAKGTVSKNQKATHKRLEKIGCYVLVAYSLDDVMNYMKENGL